MTGAGPAAAELLGPLPARRRVRKAVILAAGCGRRMGKLTRDRPKAALEVGGHALIDWQIAALKMAGAEEIAIVTGHAPEALAGRDATLIHNADWRSGTQVDSLLCAQDWIGDEDVFVSYGDILYHPCAALALLERPGDIIIAYDPDHRWLWKRRFGNWLKDSETFRLGPGQVLTEIGGKPTDIEEIDGQFMGLMLFTDAGLERVAAKRSVSTEKLDFTCLLSGLLAVGERIDTAANPLSWMEIDSAKDLRVARQMATRDELRGTGPELTFPSALKEMDLEASSDEPDLSVEPGEDRANSQAAEDSESVPIADYNRIRAYRVENAFAVQNWGRSGSTFLQSLFDDHPQVLSTPNFYSRRYYIAWATAIGREPHDRKIDAFLKIFRQWWDTGLVDATAGLHRLGPERREIAGVKLELLEGYLRAAFADGRPITRRSLFEAGHLAYALARGQQFRADGLQILFPIHGEPRGVACAFLEDFPKARFIHTLREPVTNVASSLRHLYFNNYELQSDPLESVLTGLFVRRGSRYGQPSTVFQDRAYLPYLNATDQIRFLRLEDLRSEPVNLMSEAAWWLGLFDDKRLGLSTWDGKLWWNRPESASCERLSTQTRVGIIGGLLTRMQERRVRLLLTKAHHLKAVYPTGRARSSWWLDLVVLATPWLTEVRACPSNFQSLSALFSLSWFWPSPFNRTLEATWRRELYRARLLTMNAAAIRIRQFLPDCRKPAAIRAIVILTPAKGDSWRRRALTGGSGTDLEKADLLNVAFLEDTSGNRSMQSALFWLIVLTVGRNLARMQFYVRIRLITINILIQPINSISSVQLLNGFNRTVSDLLSR